MSILMLACSAWKRSLDAPAYFSALPEAFDCLNPDPSAEGAVDASEGTAEPMDAEPMEPAVLATSSSA